MKRREFLSVAAAATAATSRANAAQSPAWLHPPLEPLRQGFLPVGDGHELYFEESGNARGTPVVYVHGGPGGRVTPANRQLFDPQRFRIILYEQRGCGRSRYRDLLAGNTTAALIGDLRRLRVHLGIERWMLCAGSWGVALALAAAQDDPRAVMGIVCRGVFLARPRDIDWIYRAGASEFFPELWREFVELVPASRRRDLPAAYFDLLSSNDGATRREAARRAERWSAALSRSFPATADPAAYNPEPSDALIASMQLKFDYYRHACYLEPGALLAGMSRIAAVPGAIINGRCDVVCPPSSALELSSAWPAARLELVAGAGHSIDDPPIARAVSLAVAALATRLDGAAAQRRPT